MKVIKIILIITFIILIVFFLFYKSDRISIEGIWSPEKIILNGKQIYPSKNDTLFIVRGPDITINEWTDSLNICRYKDTLRAGFIIENGVNGDYEMKLSSLENSLNGNFNLKVDTVHLGPLAYTIYVKLQSKATLIHFHREVRLKPRKPEFPRKGQV